MSSDREKEAELLRSYIKNVYPFYEYGYLAVVEKSTGRLIGKAGFSAKDMDDRTIVELGYIFHKDYRRQGFATEAVKEILRLAGDVFGLEEVYCRIPDTNLVSMAFARSIGFKMLKNTMVSGSQTWYLSVLYV